MLEKIDIKGGKLKYGQRIELGELFSSEKTEVQKFKETFRILHEVQPDFNDREGLKFFVNYFKEVLAGIVFWIEQEKLLRYDPEPDEVKAGIYELGKKVGHFGTVKALAKNYSCDPDDVFKWDYGKVWGILYTDSEEHKYQKRLHKIQMSKYKSAK